MCTEVHHSTQKKWMHPATESSYGQANAAAFQCAPVPPYILLLVIY